MLSLNLPGNQVGRVLSHPELGFLNDSREPNGLCADPRSNVERTKREECLCWLGVDSVVCQEARLDCQEVQSVEVTT